ncbi:MAG: class I SAM-dependent methyltransferase [Chloroflexi bacterium]|nr:class I SAM-dependent methyltransferase [Chloroflexota bacterium]
MADLEGASRNVPGEGVEQGQTWDSAAREMRTRDADAAVYEDFFTDFQTAVELRAYAAALGGTTGQRGLEVACGTGRTLGLLSASSVVGIDLSREELLLARRRFGATVSLLQASATHLPFQPGAFDQVLCAGLLLHLPTEEARLQVLQEMERVACRPARLALATHSYSWAVRRMFPRDRVHHDLFWHRTTAGELEGLLRRAFSPCRFKTMAVCSLPRWRVGNRLGPFGVWLDGLLSRLPGVKHALGTILLAQVDCLPTGGEGDRAPASVAAGRRGP